jgi:tetratricopeptide (TPR) repeat protein
VLSGTAHADEVRLELLVHLIACCPECRGTVESLAELAHEYGHWDIAEALVEWREAPLLWGRLALLSVDEQLAAIDSEEDFWTWGLCRLLQLRSADQVAENPAAAAHLAALGLRVARNLGESYDLTWVRGLRALCLASLGNARRQLGEIHAAGDAVTAARRLIDSGGGTGNEMFEAEVLLVAGLVARDGRRLREALGCFEEAQGLLAPPGGEVADEELLAAVLAHRGWCLYHLGDVAGAVSCLAAAARHNEPGRDPALAWGILVGQLWGALTLGHLDEARHLLELAREAAATGRGELSASATAAEPLPLEPRRSEAVALQALEPMPPELAEAGADRPRLEPENVLKAGVAPEEPSSLAPVPPDPGSGAGQPPPPDAGPSITTPQPPAALPHANAAVLGRAAARIALAAGQRDAAESHLYTAFADLLDAGQGVEAALAFLDLAALLLDGGARRDLSEAAVDLIRDLLNRETDLTAADGVALIRLQHACAASHLSGVPTMVKSLREAPPEPGAAAPVPVAPLEGLPSAPPPAQVTPTLLRQIAAGMERRRRPDLTWWSAAAPPLAGGEEPSDDADLLGRAKAQDPWRGKRNRQP